MATVIASTYEIIREIGSGGGGVVYLGKHLRLQKLVVLKADKRSLTVKREALRREVDTLKNLRHPYIPQVYDFLEEDGIVYTVMDYVEGESLDKLLYRGELFGQPQVIRWAKQLLEALCYLHSRPPHGLIHGDIKPSNIMLTPAGDICLIDFNIALALGEDGAARVGFSRGYSAPECDEGEYDKSTVVTNDVYSGTNKRSTNRFTGRVRSSVSGHRFISFADADNQSDDANPMNQSPRVMLDVRSDIYSVGATLYHLLSGTRPDAHIENIVPISEYSDKGISPLIANIVTKAMNPNPNFRYQTAAEMLNQFTHLVENDNRTKLHRKRLLLSAVCTTMMFTIGSVFCVVGSREQIKPVDFNIVLDTIRVWMWPTISAVLFFSLIAVITLFIKSREPGQPRIGQPVVKHLNEQVSYTVSYFDPGHTNVFAEDEETHHSLLLVDVINPNHRFSASLDDSKHRRVTIGRSSSNTIVLDYDTSVSS